MCLDEQGPPTVHNKIRATAWIAIISGFHLGGGGGGVGGVIRPPPLEAGCPPP